MSFEDDENLSFEEDETPSKEGAKLGRPPSKKRTIPKVRTEPYIPGKRQHKQKGGERADDRVYYKKNRNRRKQYQSKYYDKNKDNVFFERYIEHVQKNPRRHMRKRASAEKIAYVFLASYFIDRAPPGEHSENWRDLKPQGAPDGRFDPSTPQSTENYVGGPVKEHKHPGQTLPVDSQNAPASSGKVIPLFSDLVNKTEWKNQGKIKLSSMSMDAILAATEEEVLDRGREYQPRLYRKGPKFLYFMVGDYKVRCHFPNQPPSGFKKKFPEKLGLEDVHFNCGCKFWQWQGPEHWAKVHGYSLGKPRGTASVPVVRDPEGKKLVCKHVASVIQYLILE